MVDGRWSPPWKWLESPIFKRKHDDCVLLLVSRYTEVDYSMNTFELMLNPSFVKFWIHTLLGDSVQKTEG
jgi:hypothetical protein